MILKTILVLGIIFVFVGGIIYFSNQPKVQDNLQEQINPTFKTPSGEIILDMTSGEIQIKDLNGNEIGKTGGNK